jgi:hypothetical protein
MSVPDYQEKCQTHLEKETGPEDSLTVIDYDQRVEFTGK